MDGKEDEKLKSEEGNYCRLCAEQRDDLMDLKSDNDISKNEDLKYKISYCFDLDLSPNSPLPHTVCVDCCDSLDISWTFRKVVEKAQKTLRRIFSKRKTRSSLKKIALKLEKVDDDNMDWFNEYNKTATFSNDDDEFKIDIDMTEFPEIKSEDSEEYAPPKKKVRRKKSALKVRKKIPVKVRKKKKTDESPKRPSKADTNVVLADMWGLNRVLEDSDSVKEHLNDVNEMERTGNADGLLKSVKYRETWRNYPWICTTCDKRHFEVHRLRKHISKIHKTQFELKCVTCHSRMLDYYDFVRHVRSHADWNYLKFCCDICNAYYETTTQLNAHRLKTHTPDKPHFCIRCWSGFPTASELNKHGGNLMKGCSTLKEEKLKSPTGSEATKFIFLCELCNKTFKTRGTLALHSQIHKGRSRDFTCDKCGKAFYNKGTLSGHVVQHDDARPFKCLICGAAFKTKPRLRDHAGVHVESKPFECDQCGRCFRLRKQLRSHMIIHTDSLPYSCSYCHKQFRFQTIMRLHLRQHTGAKPYTCEQCEHDFTNWANYNKHMKRRHGIDTAKRRLKDFEQTVESNDKKFVIMLDDPPVNDSDGQMMSDRLMYNNSDLLNEGTILGEQTTFRIL